MPRPVPAITPISKYAWLSPQLLESAPVYLLTSLSLRRVIVHVNARPPLQAAGLHTVLAWYACPYLQQGTRLHVQWDVLEELPLLLDQKSCGAFRACSVPNDWGPESRKVALESMRGSIHALCVGGVLPGSSSLHAGQCTSGPLPVHGASASSRGRFVIGLTRASLRHASLSALQTGVSKTDTVLDVFSFLFT